MGPTIGDNLHSSRKGHPTMTDTNLTATGGSDFTVPSYDIAEDDLPIADEILAMNPLDIPGSGNISDGVKLPAAVPMTALPPEMREQVEKALEGIHHSKRAEYEEAAVAKVLKSNALLIRGRTGLHSDAPGYWKAKAAAANEVRQLGEEYDRLVGRMTTVARYESTTGPDGKSEPKPVYVMGAAEQAAAITRLNELSYRIGLLVKEDGSEGPEMQRRLARALFDDVEATKARRKEIALMQEAEAKSEKILWDERVDKRAEMLAKHKRSSL